MMGGVSGVVLDVVVFVGVLLLNVLVVLFDVLVCGVVLVV